MFHAVLYEVITKKCGDRIKEFRLSILDSCRVLRIPLVYHDYWVFGCVLCNAVEWQQLHNYANMIHNYQSLRMFYFRPSLHQPN